MSKADQGVFANRYLVIPRSLIFITRGNEVLLIKGNPNKRIWANRYNGIGGHIERGEDIQGAAHRELLEETNLDIQDLWLCGNIMVDASNEIGISVFVFRGEYDGAEIRSSTEGELEWVDNDSFNDLPLVDDLQPASIILNMSKGDIPFAAHTYYDENEKLIIEIH